MAIVFNTPKSALNTTSGAIQIKNGDNLQEKSVTYNQEGEFTVVPDPGIYGLSKVDITIDVPSDVHNQTATVDPSTSQQVVEPEEGYTGLSSVTVNPVTAAIDQNITAGNIKNGVSILGVTGNVEEANFEPDKEFLGDVTGKYTITPGIGYNGFEEVQVTVDSNPTGSFWNPLDVGDSQMMSDLYKNLERGGVFDELDLCLAMTVDSGRIDRETGYYVAEDGSGNVFNIKPYLENPDYNEDQPDIPQMIFPENFDLTGLNIQVQVTDDVQNKVTVNKDETDPASPVYTVEVSECDLAGINRNSDSESWHYYWDGTLSGNIEASTRNLSLSTNELSQMSISSPEPWEIEIDQPQAQSQMNVRPLAKSGLRSPAPTLNISQKQGDAGVFTLDVLSTEDQATGFTVRGLNSGNELHIDVNSISNYFTITALDDNIDINFVSHWSNDSTVNPINIEYSDDGGETWTLMELEAGTREFEGWYIYTIKGIASGTDLMFRGNNAQLSLSEISSGSTSFFTSIGEVEINGNLGSLLDKVNFQNIQLYNTYTFCGLFGARNIGGVMRFLQVTNASGLTLPKPYKNSYQSLFANNTVLTEAPELTSMALFEGCYQSMFKGCTSLKFAPELPAKLIAPSCYYEMFSGCTSLLDAPELPAPNTESSCYLAMFYGCTSLREAPVLPAKIVARSAYQNMFNGCSNISSITCLATSLGTSATYNWLSGVAAEGTFTKDANMNNWTLDSANGIPTGWTVEDYTK